MNKYVAVHLYDNCMVDVLYGASFDDLILEFIESVQDYVSVFGHRLMLTGYFDTDYVFHNMCPQTLMVTISKSDVKECSCFEK